MFDSLLAVQANQMSSSADLTALEDLLQFLEDGGFAALPETTNSSSAVSVADPISQGLSLLPDFSQTVDRTTLLNEDSSESTSGPIFSHSHFNSFLPEIDLSILQLPQEWTAVTS